MVFQGVGKEPRRSVNRCFRYLCKYHTEHIRLIPTIFLTQSRNYSLQYFGGILLFVVVRPGQLGGLSVKFSFCLAFWKLRGHGIAVFPLHFVSFKDHHLCNRY